MRLLRHRNPNLSFKPWTENKIPLKYICCLSIVLRFIVSCRTILSSAFNVGSFCPHFTVYPSFCLFPVILFPFYRLSHFLPLLLFDQPDVWLPSGELLSEADLSSLLCSSPDIFIIQSRLIFLVKTCHAGILTPGALMQRELHDPASATIQFHAPSPPPLMSLVSNFQEQRLWSWKLVCLQGQLKQADVFQRFCHRRIWGD